MSGLILHAWPSDTGAVDPNAPSGASTAAPVIGSEVRCSRGLTELDVRGEFFTAALVAQESK